MTTKTTTTTREFDEEGRLVKETVVESEYAGTGWYYSYPTYVGYPWTITSTTTGNTCEAQ